MFKVLSLSDRQEFTKAETLFQSLIFNQMSLLHYRFLDETVDQIVKTFYHLNFESIPIHRKYQLILTSIDTHLSSCKDRRLTVSKPAKKNTSLQKLKVNGHKVSLQDFTDIHSYFKDTKQSFVHAVVFINVFQNTFLKVPKNDRLFLELSHMTSLFSQWRSFTETLADLINEVEVIEKSLGMYKPLVKGELSGAFECLKNALVAFDFSHQRFSQQKQLMHLQMLTIYFSYRSVKQFDRDISKRDQQLSEIPLELVQPYWDLFLTLRTCLSPSYVQNLVSRMRTNQVQKKTEIYTKVNIQELEFLIDILGDVFSQTPIQFIQKNKLKDSLEIAHLNSNIMLVVPQEHILKLSLKTQVLLFRRAVQFNRSAINNKSITKSIKVVNNILACLKSHFTVRSSLSYEMLCDLFYDIYVTLVMLSTSGKVFILPLLTSSYKSLLTDFSTLLSPLGLDSKLDLRLCSQIKTEPALFHYVIRLSEFMVKNKFGKFPIFNDLSLVWSADDFSSAFELLKTLDLTEFQAPLALYFQVTPGSNRLFFNSQYFAKLACSLHSYSSILKFFDISQDDTYVAFSEVYTKFVESFLTSYLLLYLNLEDARFNFIFKEGLIDVVILTDGVPLLYPIREDILSEIFSSDFSIFYSLNGVAPSDIASLLCKLELSTQLECLFLVSSYKFDRIVDVLLKNLEGKLRDLDSNEANVSAYFAQLHQSTFYIQRQNDTLCDRLNVLYDKFQQLVCAKKALS